jgi:RNA polymerase sigma-70 factor (ECF subfamily)
MKCHHPLGRFQILSRAPPRATGWPWPNCWSGTEKGFAEWWRCASTHGSPDASDVIQEGYLDAMRRLDEYVGDPSVPFYIWLRFLVGQRVHEQHRRHLATPGRDVGREVSIYRGTMPGASTGALAARLLGKLTSPSGAAIRAERKIRLQEALNRMDPLDREILVLRHYEQMTNRDAALALGLDKSAASKRYTRALEQLKEILADVPGESREG